MLGKNAGNNFSSKVKKKGAEEEIKSGNYIVKNHKIRKQ